MGTYVTTSINVQSSASWASQSLSASYAENAAGSDYSLLSQYAVSASWSENASGTDFALVSQLAVSASYAPVVFSNVKISNGQLFILSDLGTGSWYALSIHDDGSGSYTTQLTPE